MLGAHWDSSFEYPQYMFWLRNKKNNFQIHSLIWRPNIEITYPKLWTSQLWYLSANLLFRNIFSIWKNGNKWISWLYIQDIYIYKKIWNFILLQFLSQQFHLTSEVCVPVAYISCLWIGVQWYAKKCIAIYMENTVILSFCLNESYSGHFSLQPGNHRVSISFQWNI